MNENESATSEPGVSAFAMPEPSDNDGAKRREYAEVTKLRDAVQVAIKFESETRKRIVRDRAYAAGKAEESWAVDANLLGHYIDILVAFLYARDPDVSSRPEERVGSMSDEQLQDFADTLGIVISKLWTQGRLKGKAKRMVRAALSVSTGWMKALMVTTNTPRPTPEISDELNTIQDNIYRLEQLTRELREQDGSTDELEVKQAELERQLEATTERIEAVMRTAMVFQFIRSERIIVSLDVDDLQDYREANFIAEEIFVVKDEALGIYDEVPKEKLEKATVYYQRAPKPSEFNELAADGDESMASSFSSSPEGEQSKGSVEFIRVLEVWDRRDNHVKTMIDGVDCWAKRPFQPQYATSRFYPYFLLGFYWVDGYRNPQSLSERLKKLQDEYASVRSNERLTRERSIPGVIFNSGQVDPKDAKAITAATQEELIGVRLTNPDRPIGEVFMEKPIGRVPAGTFDTAPILRDMEKLSGVQEALSSSVQTAKTATEAEIQQSGFAARTGSYRDDIEDVLTELAIYTAEVALQALSAEDVIRYAGIEAFWPEGLTIDDLATMVEVDIVGGTTGKPNTAGEREAWGVALPLIRETMMQIQEAQVVGNQPMADALTELLRETLRRMDDRIDVERFLPQAPALPTDVGGGDGGVQIDPTTGEPIPAAPVEDPLPEESAPQ